MAHDPRGTGGSAGATAPAPVRATGPALPPGRRARRRRARDRSSVGVALLWLGPALLLIAGVVIYPASELVKASVSTYSITGLRLGGAGGRNYSHVLAHPALGTVLA